MESEKKIKDFEIVPDNKSKGLFTIKLKAKDTHTNKDKNIFAVLNSDILMDLMSALEQSIEDEERTSISR